MIEHFHFSEEPLRKKKSPHEHIGFEETLELPSIEEVDISPTSWSTENNEMTALELLGSDILNRLYSDSEESLKGIKYKGVAHEEYRL